MNVPGRCQDILDNDGNEKPLHQAIRGFAFTRRIIVRLSRVLFVCTTLVTVSTAIDFQGDFGALHPQFLTQILMSWVSIYVRRKY